MLKNYLTVFKYRNISITAVIIKFEESDWSHKISLESSLQFENLQAICKTILVYFKMLYIINKFFVLLTSMFTYVLHFSTLLMC